MASKWMKKKESLFAKFKEEKRLDETKTGGIQRLDMVWKTPEKGTADKVKTYQVRFLTDKNDNFYKSYHYHMFKDKAGKWQFIFCKKSYGMEQDCPICSVVQKLYQGSDTDKKSAFMYKRKNKHCGNVYIVKDVRDADVEYDNDKNAGKVKIYEFPDKLEQMVKSEMIDDEYGAGMGVFDPGEDGVDFILKVGATKPVSEGYNKGKTFPDYSTSKFSNKSMAIGSDDEIDGIMEKTFDLDEYLKNMERSTSDILEILKKEFLFELIENDYSDNVAPKPVRQKQVETRVDDIPEPKNTKKEKEIVEDEISDDDLLAELESL